MPRHILCNESKYSQTIGKNVTTFKIMLLNEKSYSCYALSMTPFSDTE